MLITTNEKLKPIVEVMGKILDEGVGICGIYNIDDPDTHEVAQDEIYKETVYELGNIKIVCCSYYDYFDVYGLTPFEFLELECWYTWKKEAVWKKRQEVLE